MRLLNTACTVIFLLPLQANCFSGSYLDNLSNPQQVSSNPMAPYSPTPPSLDNASNPISAFISTKSLSLNVADEIASLAIKACKTHQFNPVSVVVMDPNGNEIVSKRMDGCPPSELFMLIIHIMRRKFTCLPSMKKINHQSSNFSFSSDEFSFNVILQAPYPNSISHAKATTCISTKSSSRAYGNKYLKGADGSEVGPSTFVRVINQIIIAGGDMAAFQGGILVKEAGTGEIVGAVGVSGAAGDEDEYCALEGVKQSSMADVLRTEPESHSCTTLKSN